MLASASPRRRDLLTAAGVRFEVRPADVAEELEPFSDPEQAALELAERKARAAAEALLVQGAGEPGPRWVLGADTVVAVQVDAGGDAQGAWRLLGKPEDPSAARAMLSLVSGTRHAVVTGVAVVRLPDFELATAAERTWVTMRPIEPAEVEAYVASGEWEGKAGGYAIQENADAFVTELSGGGFDNVVGLPVPLTLRLLGDLGARLAPRG